MEIRACVHIKGQYFEDFFCNIRCVSSADIFKLMAEHFMTVVVSC